MMSSFEGRNQTQRIDARVKKADKPFSFNLSPYSQETLMNTLHSWQLIEDAQTILCLDHKISGIGSYSCGPALADKYRLNETVFSGGWQQVAVLK